jgi:hypothetical protein
VQVIQQYVQAVLAAVVGPAHAAAGSAERRFALQASIEAQWSTLWAQVQPAELLKDTAISARELLAAEPQTLSHVAAEIRAQFEALEATFTYYAAAYSSAESSVEPGEPSAEMGAFGLTGAAAAGQPRAMSEAAWLQFAAAAALGAVGDLGWFASPNEIAAARGACVRRANTSTRVRGNRRKRSCVVSGEVSVVCGRRGCGGSERQDFVPGQIMGA